LILLNVLWGAGIPVIAFRINPTKHFIPGTYNVRDNSIISMLLIPKLLANKKLVYPCYPCMSFCLCTNTKVWRCNTGSILPEKIAKRIAKSTAEQPWRNPFFKWYNCCIFFLVGLLLVRVLKVIQKGNG